MARAEPPAARSVWTAAPPGQPQARVRLLGDAIVFACPGMRNTTQRHAATLLCSTDGQALQARCQGHTVQAPALLIAPMACKTVDALDRPLLLIDLEPGHPQYRHFQALAAPGVQALHGAPCAALQDLGRAFAAGRLQGQAVDAQVREAVAATARQLPQPAPLDPRVRKLMCLLDEDPGAALERLAPLLGLSAHHASRLFHQGLGLPLRRYALSIKIRAAASFMGSGLALTQIAQAAGFVDSAHFAKVWAQNYGAAPSRFFDTASTHIDQTDQPDWLLWYLAQRDRDLPPPAADAQTPWVHRRRTPRAPRPRTAAP
ncbi:MAG TPA: helix-turn-helix domain-containing protein [Giesbergeria sp.]|nr:helix-turn-helix domain-containing protein [Giesbergeria sp.]